MEAIPYQVIARKYRPQTFANVVGQEPIVTTLKNALRFKRLAHAYLFCGCRGTGKTTLARVFAKALNCQKPTDDFEPCNTCSSCLDITAGHALDVLEIDGASNRGIDDIRQINETVGYAPALGHYKIYIIDEVHMLTKEAFNALLKTLEEPPAHVKFFFATTEPHKILPTILSRCQRFDLSRISFEVLKEKLQWITRDLNVPCEKDVLSYIASLAEGSLRDAESLLDQIICYAEHPITLPKVMSALGVMPKSVFFALDTAFSEQNLSYAFELTSEIFSSGKDLTYFLDHLTEHYRSLLKLKLDPTLCFPSEKLKQHYTAALAFYTEEQCVYILDFLIQTQQQLSKTPFKRVHLEMLLLHIIRSKYRLTLPALVKRLQELEQQLHAPENKSAFQKPIQAPEEITPKIPALEPAEACLAKIEEPIPVRLQEIAVNLTPTDNPVEPCPAKTEEPTLAITVDVKPAAGPTGAFSKEHSHDELLIDKLQKKLDSLPVENSLLLSREEWEAKAIPQELKDQEETPLQDIATKTVAPEQEQLGNKAPSPQGCHYDTLVRFAAVELEGIIKNLTK